MKLFVTDYDDTLHTTDDEMKETVIELKRIRDNDVKVVIATGRGIKSIKKEVERLSIPFDYISCADGSIIYDNNFNVIKEYDMDLDILDELPKFINNVIYEEIQYSYDTGYEEFPDYTKKTSSVNIVILDNCFTKEVQDKWEKLKNKYPKYNFLDYKHFFSITQSYVHYLCVKRKGVSKSKSIEYLKELLNIKDNDVFVIGDADNDYEMIRDFNGVCVSGATDKIKNISKCVYEKISDFLKEI